MDDEVVEREIDKISSLLDEDCRAAALAYAVKHGGGASLGNAFVDGASWMMARVPAFFASIKETVPGDSETPSQGLE